MSGKLKSYTLLIPNYIRIFHFYHNRLLILKHKLKLHYLKLKLRWYVDFVKNTLVLTIINATEWVSLSLFKKAIFKLLTQTYKKIKLVGIGFKVSTIINFLAKILIFKLGFSHSIYLKIHSSVTYLCCQYLKVFLTSNIVNNSLRLGFIVKTLKRPDIYSGKGIFDYNERLRLKSFKSS